MCLWIVQNNLDPVPEENSFEDMQENGDKIYLNAEDEISKDTAAPVKKTEGKTDGDGGHCVGIDHCDPKDLPELLDNDIFQ